MKMNVHRAVTAIAAGFVLTAVLGASPITVHNTGVNGADVVQPVGTTTSFWPLLSKPAGATETLGGAPTRYFNGAYYADNALSGWVSPGASGGTAGVGGIYTYELLVDLTGLNPASAVISGTFGTDNSGSIFVNGNAAAATTGSSSFGAPTNFTLSSGFIAGINAIEVSVNNQGDPTAFRVQFSSATADPVSTGAPEPAAMTLLGGGLIALAMFRRKAAAKH